MKKNKKLRNSPIPETSAVDAALEKEKYKLAYHSTLRSTLYILITVVAAALLIATLIFPVIKIYGNSMSPTIQSDDIIVSRKNTLPERGQVLAFYYNNKILIRRVIGLPGDVVVIDDDGKITVNGEPLAEDYLDQSDSVLSYKGDLVYPYTVPEGYYFVLADNRQGVSDSRQSKFGNIQEEDFIGQVFFCVWPLDHLGFIR